MRQPVKRKRRKRARFLSALMAVVLLATTVPSSTFAQQTEESSTEETSTESSTTGSTSGDILNGSNEQNQSTSSSNENSGGNTSGSSSDGGEENISDSSSGGDENIPGSSSGGDENIPGSSSEGDENIPSPSAGEDEENIPGSSSDGSSSVGPSVPSSESSVEGTSVESSSVPEGGTSLPGDPENGQNGQDNEGLILKVEAYEGTAETVIYWVTEDGDAAERPAAGSYTQFKLYFSIDGGDDTELTNSTKGGVGLIDLPSVSTTDNGDGCGYRLHVEGLPSRIQYVSPETEAMEGVDQREDGEPLSVSWKIVPQDDLAEYTLHEVSDPAEVIYASKGAGWYYVKEAEQPSAPAEETEDEITVTGWRDSYSKTVFWADNQNEGEVRPSVGNYPLPKLYFTYTVTETEDSADMDSGENTSEDNENAGDEKTAGETDGSDSVEGSLTETVSGIELTEESMKQVGLTAMPEIRITDNGDSYTLTIGENILPASFERTKDGVKGTGSVEWEIVLQEVTGYDLVEVTEEDLNERPDEFFYAEATGTYYVIEGLEAEKEEETLEITGWAEESRSTVYWMDYNNGYGTRPDQVTPELYFTMSRKDGQEEEGCGKRLQLTEENLSKLGLESMPEFRMESKGTAQKDGEELQLVIKGAGGDPVPFTVDVYEVILDGESLPIALTRTVGEEKTEYIVEWEILPAEVEHYTRMEVTEDNLAQMQAEYPYVTEAGWYYVLDMGEEIGVYAVMETEILENTDYQSQIFWLDNANENNHRPRTETYKEDHAPELRFTMIRCNEKGEALEGATAEYSDEPLTEEIWSNILQLPMEDYPVSSVTEDPVNNSIYEVSTTLPTLIRQSSATSSDEAVYWKIDWEMVPQEMDLYELTNVTEGNTGNYPAGWYYSEKMDFSVDIVLRTGNLLDSISDENIKKDIQSNFELYYQAGAGEPGTLLLTDEELKDLITYEIKEDANSGLKTVTVTMEGIQKYSLAGKDIIFRLQAKENKQEFSSADVPNMKMDAGDALTIEYDNTSVPNYSGDSSGAYNGGHINLTLTGETDYTAYKNWLDPEGAARPTGTFQLWRFREESGYGSAAAVWDEKGIMNVPLNGNTEQTISFDGLPKYDNEGYEYIYVTREYLDGTTADQNTADSYTQILGKVDAEGNIQDTLAGYGEGESRNSGDINVYDKGTLSNRIAGTVDTKATKIWRASAFQAEFENVKVEFKLQSCVIGGTEWNDVEDADGNNVTRTLEGFKAELLAGQSFEESFSKYDVLGNEVMYRWVECGVYQKDENDTYGENLFTEGADGGGTFTLTQDGRQIDYISTVEVTDQNPYTTTITNSIANQINYEVEKEWNGGVNPEPITLYIYRSISGEAMGDPLVTINMDANGKVTDWSYDEDAVTELDEITGDTDSGPWKMLIEGLAEYDPYGRQYDYYLLEDTNGKSFFPIYETTRDEENNYKTIVKNGPGNGYRIMVRKHWIDDSDTLHRSPVTLTAYKISDNTKVGSVTLTNGVWYGYIPLDNVRPQEVYVIETSLGDGNAVYYYDKNEQRHDIDESKPVNPKNPDVKQIIAENDHHRYEVTYTTETIAGEEFAVVTNRRLGNVNLTVEKTWYDGDGTTRDEIAALLNNDPYKEAGIHLAIQLKFSDETPATADNGYEIRETNGLGEVKITQGNTYTSILNAGERPVSSIQTMDLNEDISTYYFYNLPKYDTNGTTVRYTVEEVWVDGNNNPIDLGEYPELNTLWSEYQTEMEETPYTVDPEHRDSDMQEILITNRRSGVKTVTWHKSWLDQYNYENSRRPDIYLDIYQFIHEKDGDDNVQEVFKLYQANYRWVFDETAGGNVITDWNAVISGLPKYDSLGYEIFYYAIEKTDVDAEAFEYETVAYSYGGGEIGTELNPSDDAKSEKMVRELSGEDKGHWALKEGGTFINRISADITVAGQKIWSGIPADFDTSDLPTVTFELWRSVVKDGNNEDTGEEGTGGDADAGQTGPDGENNGSDDSGQNPDVQGTKVAEVSLPAEMAPVTGNRFSIQYLGVNKLVSTEDGWTVEWDEVESPLKGYGKEEASIPKYDPNGNLYEYTLREVADWDDWADDDVKNRNEDADIFDEQEKEEGDESFNFTNVYKSPTGTVEAKKLLYLPKGLKKEQIPAVTFALYRNYRNAEGANAYSEMKYVTELTWGAAEVWADYQEKYSADNMQDVEGVWLEYVFQFDEEEIWAPNGAKYNYEVREIKTSEGAYDTWMVMEDVDIKTADKNTVSGSEKEPEPDGSVWYVASEEIMLNKEGDSLWQDKYVTFLNKRTNNDPGVKLNGTKVWVDDDNALNIRPENNSSDIVFKLYRYAERQGGGGTGIPREEIDTYYPDGGSNKSIYDWIWTDTDSNTWSYRIEEKENGPTLDRYAPNDMPWIYVVEETLVSENAKKYIPSPNTGTNADGKNAWAREDAASPGTIGDLSNTIFTEKSFKKQWVDSDGNPVTGDFLGYYLKVTFKLQVKTGDGNWQDANGNIPGLSDLLPNDYSFTQTLEGYLMDEDWNTGGKFTDLPVVINAGTDAAPNIVDVSWRVVESEIRYGTKEAVESGDEGMVNVIDVKTLPKNGNTDEYTYEFSPASPFSPKYENGKGNTPDTVIHQNALESTGFSITKRWVDDAKNAYKTRPETNVAGADWETCFVLQRTSKENPTEADWDLVTVYTGTDENRTEVPYVVYMTGTNDTEEKTIMVSGLPTADESGRLKYRARELDPDFYNPTLTGEELKANIEGAICGDDSKYYVAYDVKNEDAVAGSATTVTNTLDDRELYAKKKWLGGESIDGSITFYLEYLKKSSDTDTTGTWKRLVSVTLDGSSNKPAGDEEPAVPYYEIEPDTDGNWRVTFTHLPRRLRGSLFDKDSPDSETQYRVTEQSNNNRYIQDGGMTGNGEVDDPLTLTNTVTTSLTIMKEWAALTVPGSITVTIWRTHNDNPDEWRSDSDGTKEVYQENGKDKKVALTSPGWTTTLSNLPKYDSSDKRWYYYAVEDSPGANVKVIYEDSIAADKPEEKPTAPTETVITNIGIGSIEGTKTWQDNTDKYGTRPYDHPELTLYRTTEDVSSYDVDDWLGEWQETGGWEVVTKVEDGEKVEPTWEKISDNEWKFIYNDLELASDNGEEYTFAVKETKDKGNYIAVATDAEDWTTGDYYEESRAETNPNLNLINTLHGEMDVVILKEWDDNNAPDRLTSIDVELKGIDDENAGTPSSRKYTLKASPDDNGSMTNLLLGPITRALQEIFSSWKVEVKGLEKYDANQRHILYSVEEIAVPGHDVAYDMVRNGNLYTFTITNTKRGNLTVSKTVTGSDGESGREWHFTVTLTGAQESITGKYGDMEFVDGVASFTLRHGESKTATNLPAYLDYLVVEQEANRNGYSTSVTGTVGKIPAGATAVAAFTNHRDLPGEEHETDDDDDTPPTTVSANAVPPVSALPIIPWITGAINGAGVPTGDMAAPLLYIGLAVLALAVIVIVLITGKKPRKKRHTSGQAGRKRSRRKNRK